MVGSIRAVVLPRERPLNLFSHANPLDDQIESAFKQAYATLEEIDMPLLQAVSDSEKRLLVVRLKQELSQLKNLVASDVADILGISLGFNSLDGD